MGLFDRFRKKPKERHYIHKKSGFFSSISPRVFTGWDASSSSIDHYLKEDLTAMRARSRELSRKNPYINRYVEVLRSNVVGPDGIKVSAQKTNTQSKPDKRSNDAVEKAWKDWCDNHADYNSRASFCEMQQSAMANIGIDGEYIYEIKQSGKYNFQLKAIDAELLDIDKHQVKGGGEIRLGVEYDAQGRRVRYWFKEKNHNGDYGSGRSYSIRADRIIHNFISKFSDQSRGIPLTHAALEAVKHLEKYQEGAIVNARASANTFVALKSTAGNEYQGDEDMGDGLSYDSTEAGTIRDFGDKEPVSIDPNYPHQMYDAFIKANLRSIASGLGVSYHALANDLEGVNYSSIRAGVLEDRELFKFYQNWMIRTLIKPVFEEFIKMAYTSGQIILSGGNPVAEPVDRYLSASYQARRWAWVDPQKDMNANKMYIEERLKSRTQIMREQGDEPDEVWQEIAKEQEIMKSLGLIEEVKPEEAKV